MHLPTHSRDIFKYVTALPKHFTAEIVLLSLLTFILAADFITTQF